MTSGLLTIMALLLPLAELFRFRIPGWGYFRVIDPLVILLTILFIARKPKLRQFPALLGFLGVIILSNLANPFNLPGFLYLGRTVAYLLLLPQFVSSPTKPTKFFQTIFKLSLAILIISGLMQYLFYPDLRNLYYLGYDPHSYRLFGLFLDPNILGIVLVWAFFYFGRSRIKFKIPLLVITGLALLLTYSRSSWLCFIIGLVYLASIKKSFWPMMATLLIFAAGIFLLPHHFGEGTNLWRTNSLIGKQESVKLVVRYLRQQPLLGIGFNNTNLIKTGSITTNNSLFGIDSSLLTVTATSGILGLLSYLWLWWWLFWSARESGKLFTLTYFVHSLLVNSFFTPTVFLYYLFFNYLGAKLTQRK